MFRSLPLFSYYFLVSLFSLPIVKAIPPLLEENRNSHYSNSTPSAAAHPDPQRNREFTDTPSSRVSLFLHGTDLAIGTPENSVYLPIEAGEYCDFLNALVPSKRHAFYMAILEGREAIEHSLPFRIAPNNRERSLSISQTAALHYCNWRENNTPSYLENLDSTEYGTYDLEENTEILSINKHASFFVPGILSDTPDSTPVSQLGLVLLTASVTPLTKKIPERTLSSIQNKVVFTNTDFAEEWNRIQLEQEKWNVHFKKALVKKSKKAPEILTEGPRLKISLEQKLLLLEEQLANIPKAKKDQIKKLIHAHEMLLETVKHTCNIVKERVALSKLSPFFPTPAEMQEKLADALQWAKLTPDRRAFEFKIEIMRKSYENILAFETTDKVWKLAEETSELILHSSLEVKNFSRIATKALVNIDSFKKSVATASRNLTSIIDKLKNIANTATALDSRLSLPLDGITALLNLITDASEVFFRAGAENYESYLRGHEEHLHGAHIYAQEQFVSLSAYAEALEKNALLDESEKTLQKASTAKSHSPIPDSLLWKLWGSRVNASKENLSETCRIHNHNIREADDALLESQKALLPLQQEKQRLLAVSEQAQRALEQATTAYRKEQENSEQSPEQLYALGLSLTKTTEDKAKAAEQLRNISQDCEKKEIETHTLLKKLKDTKTLARRLTTRAENFAKFDEEVWYFVWPQRAPKSINQNQLLAGDIERLNPLELRNNSLLAQQLATTRGIFTQLQACYDRVEGAFSSHIHEEKSFEKPLKKQVELFTKTAERIQDSTHRIVAPQESTPFYHMIHGAFEINTISKELAAFLNLIVSEISPHTLNEDEALEHKTNALRDDFAEKASHLQINGWDNEIKWAQEVIEKLAALIALLRLK